jgi:hypothetical protein
MTSQYNGPAYETVRQFTWPSQKMPAGSHQIGCFTQGEFPVE